MFTQLGVVAGIPWTGGAIGEIAVGDLPKKMVDRQLASLIDAKRLLIAGYAAGAAVCAIALPI
ncbi:MAG: hypothetical protein WCA85_04225 [Paraburkholderia sp.]|uniref:hypothetical protein n=1 Tax=Paraburkholderia sp. TaxID=1926495 RepID=UPI003C3B6A88